MMFRGRQRTGIRFAWLPVWTVEGKVWLEWVHVHTTSHGDYTYRRWVPEEQYQKGETWEQEKKRLFAGPMPTFYATPPDREGCRAFADAKAAGPDVAAACWYPHCTCMDQGGSQCPE